VVEAKNNAESLVHTAEKQLGEWKHVSDAEKENVRTLLQELQSTLGSPNSSKDDIVGATDKLQKAVMECGRTEYQQAAAANQGSSEQKPEGEQKTEEQKPEGEEKK
jgi:molecular chaperone DnaK